MNAHRLDLHDRSQHRVQHRFQHRAHHRAAALAVPLLLLGGAAPAVSAVSAASAAGALGSEVAAPSAQVRAANAAGARAATGPVDTASSAAVRGAYNALWASAQQTPVVPTGGSTSNPCSSYSTPANAQQATQNAVNFARGLAGENGVSFDAGINAKAASAALIMAASGKLSHSPDGSFSCTSATGTDAAGKSNILIDGTRTPSAARIAQLYLDDPGSGNTAVGHRRWLLRPEATVMGSGNASGSSWFGNAIYVFTFGNDDAGAPARQFYSWPTAGFFPTQLEPQGRWSLSSSNGSGFANASVSVTGPGGALPVRRYAPENGYGDNTLAFDVSGIAGTGSSSPTTYTVTVSGISGSGPSSYTYYVRLFDPTAAGGDLVLPVDANGGAASAGVTTHTTIKVRHKSVRRHHKVRIKLHSRAANGARPSGRFVIYVGRHRVKTVALRASARQRGQTVSLRFGTSGRKRVHAVFIPDGGYAMSVSRSVQVQVH